MSGSVQTVEGLVLTRALSPGGFDRLTVLTRERGLYPVFRRVSANAKGSTSPDLFDTASLVLNERRAGAFFLSEYSLLKRRTGLGAGYALLAAASKWAAFASANAVHMESTAELFDTGVRLLDALDAGATPGPALFKAYYLFGRSEGLPVREDWFAGLSAALAERAAFLLQTPLPELAPSYDADGAALAESVLQWMCGNHDILPPRGAE